MASNKKRILIVEDEDVVRNYCLALLQELGFDVDACDRVTKAINMLQNNHYDVILSDLVMPEHDGLSLLKMLKDLAIDVPVIIMTAYACPRLHATRVFNDIPMQRNSLKNIVDTLSVRDCVLAIYINDRFVFEKKSVRIVSLPLQM